nr:hypothetical protein [Tanacetum cinerariifolium]
MSSDNAKFTVTYTSISSDSDGPSWGIPLMNASEFLKMDPYEEVAQQGQIHPLSPAYVSDPMELDEHVPIHVLEPEHSEYHAQSDDDIQVEDDDEDPKEDPSEEHEPEDDDDDEDPEEDPMKNMSLRIRMLMRPNRLRRKRLLSYHHHLDTGLIRSPGHDARTIARATDRVEDVGYVKALQAFERRMMTSIEEVNLRVTYQAQVRRHKSKYLYTKLHDAQINRRDIILKIDVVRG